MKEAMKSGDKNRLSTIRLLLSEIRNAQIAKKGELDDQELLQIVAREAKRRKEAIEEFSRAGRQDLVDRESAELEILMTYLPEQLSDDELRSVIEEAIEKVGASSSKDLGKVMGRIMPELKGRADGKLVGEMTREMLEST